LDRIPLYVLNNFLKFDRKIYQLFGLRIGRAVPLKGLLYFLGIVAIEVVWYFTPVLGILIRWVSPGLLLVFPIVLAWLLTDVGTEGRSPLAFFRSLFLYHMRKLKADTLYRGRKIEKEKTHTFYSHYTYSVKKNRFRKQKHGFSGFLTYR